MKEKPLPRNQPLTTAEFCERARISRRTLYRWWAQGYGPDRYRSGRQWLISAKAYRTWRSWQRAIHARPAS